MAIEANEVVLVSACRTPIGDYGGSLKPVPANELTKIVATEAIKRAGIEAAQVNEIVAGMCLGHGNGSCPPRIVAMQIGMDPKSSACMVNQNCASAMRALEIAAMKLQLGKYDIALVTGTESMSNIPYIDPTARWGARMGDVKLMDAMLADGLVCQLAGSHMGVTAENIAELYGITREECDQLALISHRRAVRAIDEGRFNREIIPVPVKERRKEYLFSQDEHPIRDASLESMAKLKPAFKKDGVVTAANASGLNDAAAAVVLMTKQKAKELGLKPLMKLINICDEGVEARVMGLGPAVAIPRCLREAGMNYADVDYWEINEAFAAQVLGVGRKLKEESGIDMNIGTVEQDGNVNNNGSGIALGHPVGCTGLRIIVSLYYELERLGKTVGGASLCVGGGAALASLWTRDV
ncbi:thiolase family protein [Desulfosporosinus sp. PR]|uniref:thiolase family protein n=1 Tax=Candidatus Desulfosporosinus nitrosoreducens TaxID=3401928 RepID=UPI0027FBD3BF|nr:thiolase family protein [Desulfosporosinus sp. PR]MDQ7092900.1 thiolase family protein [Desulfosporosinus sp. PR]